MMKTNKTTMATLSVFGTKPANEILVPEFPLGIRNDCQIGRWKIGDRPIDGDITMSIIKVARFFGDLGTTKATDWLQVWFIAESGNLPPDTVMVTYLKTRSLGNFYFTITTLMAKGIEPASGIFKPKFEKYSGNIDGQNTSYYGLIWDWEPRSDPQRENKFVAVLDNIELSMKMVDSIATKLMAPVDLHQALSPSPEDALQPVLD
jgi:hypothetical protein